MRSDAISRCAAPWMSAESYQGCMQGIRVEDNRKGPARRRIGVVLDPEVFVEALILRRIEALPKRRQAGWVRDLLVRGFLAESRDVRALQIGALPVNNAEHRVPRVPCPGFTLSARSESSLKPASVTRTSGHTERSDAERSATDDGLGKPFAYLRKVVG